MDDYQPMEQPAAAPAAAPAPPAAAQQPAAPADFDFTKADPAKVSQVFQDPRFLAQAAHAYLSRGLPEGIKYLEHAHTAAKENAFEALTRLEQGDGEGAIEAFNQSGRFTGATSAKDNGDGTWTLGDKDGRSTTINPVNLKKTLLSPQAYFAATEAEKRTGILQQQRDDQKEHYRRLDDNKAEQIQATRDIADAKASGAANTAYERFQAAQAAAAAKGEATAAKITAEREKLEITAKTSPDVLYSNAFAEAQKGGSKDPAGDARRAVAGLPRNQVKVDPESGQVAVFDQFTQFDENGRPNRKPVDMFKDATEYESVAGRRIPTQQKAAVAAEGAAKAAPVTPARRVENQQAKVAEWAASQNDGVLKATVQAGGPYAQYAQQELERRAANPAPAQPLNTGPAPSTRYPSIRRITP